MNWNDYVIAITIAAADVPVNVDYDDDELMNLLNRWVPFDDFICNRSARKLRVERLNAEIMNKYNFYLKVFIKVIESSIVVRSKTTADEDRQNKRNAYRMIMNSRLDLCIEEVRRERLLMELLWCAVVVLLSSGNNK